MVKERSSTCLPLQKFIQAHEDKLVSFFFFVLAEIRFEPSVSGPVYRARVSGRWVDLLHDTSPEERELSGDANVRIVTGSHSFQQHHGSITPSSEEAKGRAGLVQQLEWHNLSIL